MSFFVVRRYRATFSSVTVMICRKENSGPRPFVIASRMEVIRSAGGGNLTDARHPSTIGLNRLNLSQGFTLRRERCAIGYIRFTSFPTLWGFTGSEEFSGVFKS